MADFITAHTMAIFIVEVVILSVLFTVWEKWHPFIRRSGKTSSDRQANHFLLLAINQGLGLFLAFLISRLFVFTVDLQEWAPLSQIGLSGIPLIIVGIILLDLSGYTRHRIMHLSWFWPTHKLHHSDANLDWTSEWRFHPLEVLVTIGVRFIFITSFSIPSNAIALFAVIALPIGLFQHANIALPQFIERILGIVIVTPALHRVHHSSNPKCYDKNFAVLFITWDKLFRSFKPSEKESVFGLDKVRGSEKMALKDMLISPFKTYK